MSMFRNGQPRTNGLRLVVSVAALTAVVGLAGCDEDDIRNFQNIVGGGGALNTTQLAPPFDATGDLTQNQARSSAFGDLRDQGGVANAGAFAGLIQQLNSPGQDLTGVRLGALAFAFGENTSGILQAVNNDVTRIEFNPVDGATGYRVVITSTNGTSTFNLDTSAFQTGVFQNNSGNNLTVETTAVTRNGSQRLVFIYEAARLGDQVAVSVLNGSTAVGTASSTVLSDNIPPTVTLQRSFQDLITYASASASESQNGCSVRAAAVGSGGIGAGSGTTTTTLDRFVHAGVSADGGTGSNRGTVCAGVSPHLLIAQTDTDGDISSAHDELVAQRSPALNAALAVQTPTPYFAEIYDAQAFPAWPVAARQSTLGIAFSEALSSVGSPNFGSGAATFSNPVIRNGTNNSTINGTQRFLFENRIDVTVSDVLALSQDAGRVLNFTGVRDASGVLANSAANARTTIRDQWAPYMTSGSRQADGSLQFTWNEPVVVDSGDVLSFIDPTTGNAATLTFTGGNSTSSNSGATVTVSAANVPADVAALFSGSGLVYADQGAVTRHVIADWRSIADNAGNAWAIYARSFADAGPFADDVPTFSVVDLTP